MGGKLNNRPRRTLSTDQVTLRELVKDPVYRQWLKTEPVGGFPTHVKFRVYAQREEDGRWAKKDFDDFKSAYNFLAKNLKYWHDAAINTRTYSCRPPVVRVPGKVRKKVGKRVVLVDGLRRVYYAPILSYDGHIWCPYCRRPTVFAQFSDHHAFTHANLRPLPFKARCSVCGIAETAIKHYTAKGVQ